MNSVKLGGALAALAVSLTLAPFAAAQKNPSPVDLGTLGGSFSQAAGIGGKDNVVGASSTAGDATTHAFITSTVGTNPIKRLDLGTLVGAGGTSAAVAISGGAVAGTSDFNYTDPTSGDVITSTHSFYLPVVPGSMQDIGTLGGDTTQATYMRNGCVVGSSYLTDNTATHGFLWCAFQGTMTDLAPLPDGSTSQAFGVNSSGTIIVGSSDVADGSVHVAEWLPNAGRILDLGTLGGSFAQANAVSAYGLIVGAGSTADDLQTNAFIGIFGALIDIGNLGGSYAQANAVSDNGLVVGYSNTAGDTDVHAFLWTARRGMVDMNSLLPPGTGWILQTATGIATDGTIVGTGILNGQSHAFAW